jgi:hypothetical protein
VIILQLYVLEANRLDSKTACSGIVQYKDQIILINLCSDLKNKLKKAKITPKTLSAVLITNPKGIDNLQEFIEWQKEEVTPFYCNSQIKKEINNQVKACEVFPYDSFKLADCIIMPFAINENIGYRFENSLTWSDEFSEIPLESQRYFDHVDFVVTPNNVIKTLAENHFKKLYVLSETEERSTPKVEFLQDEMNISLISAYLTESREGLSLTPAQAKYLWYGNKKLIVQDKDYQDKVHKKLYLLGGDLCYGFIVLGAPRKISLSHFEELKDKHKITDNERKRWWGDKKVLFAYSFNFERLSEPKKIKEVDKMNTFVEDIVFLQDITALKNPIDYNPNVPDNEQLSNDLITVNNWHITKKKGDALKFTLEQIEALGIKIYEEVLKREVELDCAKLSKDFFELISKNTYKGSQIELIQPKLSIQHCKSLGEIMENLK